MVELDFFPTDKQLLLIDILKGRTTFIVLYYASVKNHQSNCRHVHSSSLICSNLEQIN